MVKIRQYGKHKQGKRNISVHLMAHLFFLISIQQYDYMANEFMNEVIKQSLEGLKLYGDDFSPAQIEEWFKSEQEGYHDIYEKNYVRPPYGYHLFNKQTGFNLLPQTKLHHVLGFGAGNGDELQPILKRSKLITILDPSDEYISKMIGDTEIRYSKPQMSGELEFDDNTFDLVCCLSALHHVPNVSLVLQEFYRCLMPGGYLIVREPIVSMGDWRKPRRGLTKNERGIPIKLFDDALNHSGFSVVSRKHVLFPLLPRLAKILKIKEPYNHTSFIMADKLLCYLTKWNNKYHPTSNFQKIHPVALAYVLKKPI